MYLPNVFDHTKDQDNHFKYIYACTKWENHKEIGKLNMETNYSNFVKVKDFWKEMKMSCIGTSSRKNWLSIGI